MSEEVWELLWGGYDPLGVANKRLISDAALPASGHNRDETATADLINVDDYRMFEDLLMEEGDIGV